MSQKPVNLVVRFLLELAALYFIGRWGWFQGEGLLRYVLAIGLPLLAALIWGTFRVPGDGGTPRVQVRGVVRLFIGILWLCHMGIVGFWRLYYCLGLWRHYPAPLPHLL